MTKFIQMFIAFFMPMSHDWEDAAEALIERDATG